MMEQGKFSKPLDLHEVKIRDAFWGREQELVRREVIPYQWDALNDRVPGADPSFCMRNFKVAGRLMREQKNNRSFRPPQYTFRGFNALPEEGKEPEEDKFYGFVFQDSDFSKWIEAVGYSLVLHPDPQLEKIADEAIDIVVAAQAPNGYLDTYYIIGGMDRIFTHLQDHHELYCFGHLLEGAISYYQATGKDKLLKAAQRYADFVAEKFGPEEGKIHGYPGHEIAEMALARLYELTGEDRYLKLAKFFLDERGKKPYIFDEQAAERAAHEGIPYVANTDPNRYVYYQAAEPVRQQSEAVGHAVRAVYLYSGMADVARLSGDEELYRACERIWDSIVAKKLYITGGIGSTHLGEAFSHAYDLPNDLAYSETCAAIGLAFFARRMLQISPESRYGDVMERALYNTVLAGMALDGRSFFYVNPLEVVPEDCKKDPRKMHVKPVRQKWFGCACCPPNIARTVSSLGAYLYTVSEDTLYLHLYAAGSVEISMQGGSLQMEVQSNFPVDGKVKLSVKTKDTAGPVTLALRIPGWCCGKYKCQGGEALQSRIEKGYLYLTGDWSEQRELTMEFDMTPRAVMSDPCVREDADQIAWIRGPLTYCMEEADNGRDLVRLLADGEHLGEVKEERDHSLGHEMICLLVPGKRETPVKNGAFIGDGCGCGMDIDKKSLYGFYEKSSYQDSSIRLIPYYAWANRGEGEMRVWIRLFH